MSPYQNEERESKKAKSTETLENKKLDAAEEGISPLGAYPQRTRSCHGFLHIFCQQLPICICATKRLEHQLRHKYPLAYMNLEKTPDILKTQ